MLEILDGVTVPWFVGGLGIVTLFVSAKAFGAWRQRKRAPYFFMRQHAGRQFRLYLWMTVVLAAVTVSSAFYVEDQPVESAPLVALLSNTKPVPVSETASDELPEGITIVSYETPTTVDFSALSPASDAPPAADAAPGNEADIPLFSFPDPTSPESINLDSQLPAEYDQVDPSAELTDATSFSPLAFATDINDAYEPVAPRQVFGEGFFTIYATFIYNAMADGMAWSWVWRHNGQIVNGGNEIWGYGSEGPGWIYYAPPEGFQEGEYTLEVWVNGRLFSQSSITVEQGVANQ